METLPKGIRQRGKRYQAIITFHSKQYSATFTRLQDAVKWRQDKAKSLNREIPVNSPKTLDKTCTIETAADRALSVHWSGTKAERTAEINARFLVRFFGPQTKLTAIDTQAIEALVLSQKRDGKANATINRKLACLSVILRTAEDYGYKTANPKLLRRKEYKGRDIFLTPEEEEKILCLLESWGKKLHKLAFIILLDTGVRMSECLTLKTSDIDFSQGKHGILNIWTTKNNTPRSVPMTERLSTLLMYTITGKGPNDDLFPTHKHDWFRVVWDRLRAQLGQDSNPQFVPHILRHTCASRLVKKGVPLIMVQRWLGHQSIQSTMRYAHLAPEALYDYVD